MVSNNEEVFVSYEALWEGMKIQDQFMWPKANRRVHDMKVFAMDYLSDQLGEKLHDYEDHQLECIVLVRVRVNFDNIGFAGHVAYLIQRELDLADLEGKDFYTMAQDGLFGKCLTA